MLTWDRRKFNVSKADRINGNHRQDRFDIPTNKLPIHI